MSYSDLLASPQAQLLKLENVRRKSFVKRWSTLHPFHPAQKEIYEHPARYKVLDCGRKFGKTIYLEYDIILDALLKPAPYAFCSLTYKALVPVWNDFKTLLVPYTKDKSESLHQLTLDNGSIIDLWSLEDPEPIRPREYEKIAIDEAAAHPKLKYVWEEAISATLTKRQGRAVFGSTPRGKLNYFYELYQLGMPRKAGGEWASWKLPTSDNPHIHPDEIEAARRRMSAEAFSQEYMAEFVLREGAVFPNFSDEFNVSYEAVYVPGYDVEWGVDVGYSNPTCILLAQERPYKDVPDALVIFDMVYKDHMLPAGIIQDAHDLGYPAPEEMYYDPSAPTFAAEFGKIRDERGDYTSILGGDNSTNTTEAIRRWICDSQGVRRLIIHPKCHELIMQLQDYHYNPNSNATIAGDPKVVKEEDHAVDSLRYLNTKRVYR